ncbi:DUF6518 family protein [Kutzneria sp. CA-103260]|uniref:DUF6518 family protein n=1 Tax=Kutzneria sp. CA-103260 TaxID=2802641 RepID=UPI001BA6EEAD|nr:DUF6518 family protein [Kutzneria sp. CA-103260]QUQ69777.1 hypothetical protein JJ691_75390 [Kutzneria sp. CA-103260]
MARPDDQRNHPTGTLGAEGQDPHDHAGWRRFVMRAGVVVVGSLVLGGLTFFAQGVLPEVLSSVANSASGWTLLAVLLIFWARLSPAASAVLGAASFLLLVLGYTLVAKLQGLFYSPIQFGLVGIVAGPFVGVATAWLRSRSQIRTAFGAALLSGIGVGEGIYGLVELAASTSPVYWVVIIVVGLALLSGIAVRRLRSRGAIAVAVTGTAVVAAAFNLAYVVLGRII